MTYPNFKKIGAAFIATAMLATTAFAVSAKTELGDANADGKINVEDATYIQKTIAKLETASDDFESVADVYGDGIINIRDATVIQMYCAHLIDSLPYDPDGSNEDESSSATQGKETVETRPTSSTSSTDKDGWNNQIIKP